MMNQEVIKNFLEADAVKIGDPTMEAQRDSFDEHKETVVKVCRVEGPTESQEWVLREDETNLPLMSGLELAMDFNFGMIIKKEDIKIEFDQQPEVKQETNPGLIASKTNDMIPLQENKSTVLLTLNDEPTVVNDTLYLMASSRATGSMADESGVNLDKTDVVKCRDQTLVVKREMCNQNNETDLNVCLSEGRTRSQGRVLRKDKNILPFKSCEDTPKGVSRDFENVPSNLANSVHDHFGMIIKKEDIKIEADQQPEAKQENSYVCAREGRTSGQQKVLRKDKNILPFKSCEETAKGVSRDFEDVPSNLGMIIRIKDIKIEADPQPEINGETGDDLVDSKTNDKISLQEDNSRVSLTLNDESCYEHKQPVPSVLVSTDLDPSAGGISQISANISRNHRDQNDPEGEETSAHSCSRQNMCEKQFDSSSDVLGHIKDHAAGKGCSCNFCAGRFSQVAAVSGHERSSTAPKPMREISSKQFSKSSYIKAHEKPYNRDVTSKLFSTPSALKTHQKVLSTTHQNILSGRKPFKCDVCSKQFSRSSGLRAHNAVHSGSKRYKCDVCYKEFSRSSNLRKHERVHSDSKLYKCNGCPEQFSTSYFLKKHQSVHSGRKQYKCDICPKKFSTVSNVKKHQLIHSGSKPHMCDVCSKQFSQSSSLKMHQMVHSGIKPYMCDICSKQFSTISHLNTHQTLHSDSKPYKCHVCSKQFSTPSYLKKHQIVHSDSKPYKCNVCSKKFSAPSYLKKHQIVHSGRKPYKCNVCSKKFSKLGNLQAHGIVHSGSKPYKCDICSKQFSTASCLKVHGRVHSGSKPLKCDICSKQFSTPSCLKVHGRVHSGSKPYKCDICSKHFSTSSYLKVHERVHSGIKPFKCDVCCKLFSTSSNLNSHKKVHSSSKRYKCDVCSKQFRTSSNLKVHERVHSHGSRY